MSRLAIVKPDHLGDLVLSVPAIRALGQSYPGVTLFVASSTLPLARFLFPELELRPADLPHLVKGAKEVSDPARLAAELSTFECVLWLRDDPPIRALAQHIRAMQDFATGSHLIHESASQKRLVTRYAPNYSRTRLFHGSSILWPKTVRRIGLCISAGFPTNVWPVLSWLGLAAGLARAGIELALIGGPNERLDLALLSRSLGRIPHETIEGGRDFRAFLGSLAALDLIVATDSGSAHICSLAKPILSLFGASPWRRYAPFGRDNLVVTSDLACAPCLQFSTEQVNGCVSRECLAALAPSAVLELLTAIREGTAESGPVPPKVPRLFVQRGASHSFEA